MKEKKLIEKIHSLSKKYSATGQDLSSYLDGLLYADYMGYWDYIHLDTLLSLQNPKTDFPDEEIFITYHQITELFFKLCLSEIEQINKNSRNVLETGEDLGWKKNIDSEDFILRLERVNRYFDNLINSFDIMIEGMSKSEFLKFRMALLPSSGFQSAQFRMIEIRSTKLTNLGIRKLNSDNYKKLYENLYWKSGAHEASTNKKTYTLKQFEKKYNKQLLKLCNKMQDKNIWTKYTNLSKSDQKNKTLIRLLKQYDYNINIRWKLAHYKSAAKHLTNKLKDTKATGGTNWKKYLPPKFQKIIFFPELWTPKEKNDWGKQWVESVII